MIERPLESLAQPSRGLTVLAAALVLGMWMTGGLTVAPGGPDSAGYIALQDQGLRTKLEAPVTIGYPVFLSLVALVSPTLSVLPYLQLALHILAVFCFLAGLRSLRIEGPIASLICGSLLFSELALGSSRLILTDGPGSSFAIMSVGMLMRVVGAQRRWTEWLGLAAAAFLAYQTRPAYTFLIPVLPMLGAGVALLVLQTQDLRVRWKSLGLGLLSATILPFLLFCSFRWATIGRFGLVSSSGTMMIGVVGQFLDDDVVARLPEDLRPIAGRALERRQELPDLRVASVSEMSDRSRIEARHHATQMMFLDLLAPLKKEGSWLLVIDGQKGSVLSRLSLEIIRQRPRLYALQVAKEFRAKLKICVLNHDASIFMLLFLGLLQLVMIMRPRREGAGSFFLSSARASEASRAICVMFFIAMTFCVSKLLLVVLILPPVDRYLAAAGVFMPTLIAIPLAIALQQVGGPREVPMPASSIG